MPANEDISVRPSTPEKRRRDGDPLFSTPTSGTDIQLKLMLLQQRHNKEDAAASQAGTPECSADIEGAIEALKKQHDERFEDVCFILRKVGKRMHAYKVQNEELKQKNARLEAEKVEIYEAELAEFLEAAGEVPGTSCRLD
ncbi:hypothetical protein BGZ61DRAFT_462464 [Ilyonectria robusta]|uniref:uncharacterized protein n=1 Tax=Ilyonectria robusta TaxID=1079257 RepID=UPI001E8CFD3E|nr:uncharacterized protein BGZ61DRAFT_462464 [Ilyonectria robusta]KAH8664863.1 hypothetical protein BGZ61DRAFT_462464 [Ilyonectria robusta]